MIMHFTGQWFIGERIEYRVTRILSEICLVVLKKGEVAWAILNQRVTLAHEPHVSSIKSHLVAVIKCCRWLWTRSSHWPYPNWPDLWTVYPLVKLVLQQLLGNTYLLFRTLVVWWHSSSLISIAATKRRAHANPALWRWLWIVFQHVQWFFQATKTKPLQKCQSTASYVV